MNDDGELADLWIPRLAGASVEPLLEPSGAVTAAVTTGRVGARAGAALHDMAGGDPLGLQLLTVAATKLVLRSLSGNRRHVVVMPVPGTAPTEVALSAPVTDSAPVAKLLGQLHRELETSAPLAWSDRSAVADRLSATGAAPPRVLSQISVRHIDIAATAGRPSTVELVLRPLDDGLVVQPTSPTGSYPAAVTALARCVAATLTAIAADVHRHCRDVDILGDEQRAELDDWSGRPGRFAARTLCGIVEAAAGADGGAIAVADGTIEWSHRELDSAVAAAAARLRDAYGVSRGDRVALLLPRGADLVLAVLAVLRAGASYVPLDPGHPAGRVSRQLRLSQARWVIASGAGPLDADGIDVIETAELHRNPAGTAPPADAPAPDDEAVLFFTSGSTGDPRPVALTHRQLAHKAVTSGRQLGFDARTRCALLSAITSDALTYQIFTTLAAGGRLVPMPAPEETDPRDFWDLVDARGVNVVNCVPSVLAILTEGIPAGTRRRLRHCLLGGDAIPVGLLPRLAERLEVETFANLYGPTEVTVEAVSFHCAGSTWPDLATVPIGRPSPGFGLRVLTGTGELAPVGVPGELYLLGPGVAERGYHDDDPAGPHRFVSLPGKPGIRAFRTGDFARWNPDGTLAFLGRADNQVQVHGNRVEPAEVEKALSEIPGVLSGAVVPLVEGSQPVRLIAAYTTDAAVPAETVRSRLAELLPRHMVPGIVTAWDELPLTVHGKVDRKAITAAAAAQTTRWRPGDDTDRLVAEVWTKLLGGWPRSATEDFIAAGGHSLTATMLAQRLCEAAGDRAITVREVFAARTPQALAEVLRRPRRPVTPEPEPPLPDRAAAGNAQRRMWYLERYEEGELRPFNMVEAFRLHTGLDVLNVTTALERVVERHQALRTVLRSDGDTLEQVVLPADAVPVEVTGLVAEPADAPAVLAEVIAAEQRWRMDLAAGPLLRATWIAEGDGGVLVLTVHHSVCDGWSFAVILRDLSAALTDTPIPEPVQYLRHCRELDARRGGPEDELARTYWHRQLADLPEVEIPLDRHRTANRDSRGGAVWLSLGEEVTRGLLDLCRQLRVTQFAAQVAVLRVLLYRLSHHADIPLGTVMSGREDPRLADSVGMFANTVVLRTPVGEHQTFRDLVAEVARGLTDAAQHQEYPFELLVDELAGERVAGRNPLFDVLVESLLEGTGPMSTDLPIEHLRQHGGTADFDLAVGFTQTEGSAPIEVALIYRDDVLDRATVERLAAQLRHLARGLVAAPDAAVTRAPFLPEDQREYLLDTVNRTTAPFPADRTLLSLVSEQVERHGDRPAVVCGDRRLSFAELDERADRLAVHLAATVPTGPGRLVAMACDRTEWMVVALVAVLKTGSAFMPVDPEQPTSRLAAIVRAAGAVALLSDLPRPHDPAALPPVIDPSTPLPPGPRAVTPAVAPTDLAYVVHTSGSTGTPKGVMVEHRGIVNTVHFRAGYYGFDTGSCVLQVPPIHFDSGINDVFSALIAATPVVVTSRERLLSPDEVAELIETNRVTHVMMVPSLYQVLLDRAAAALRSVRQVVLVGERLPESLVERHARLLPDTTLYNEYGPAEDSVWTTVHRITDATVDVLIGHPIDNKTVDLLDADGELVPLGVPGEICVGGVGVARGYLNDPELTARRFTDNPVRPGTRMYRTGDLARRLPDGNLQYLGRVDDQVKIRGQRVEPGEVAAVLSRAPGVRGAAVVAQPGPDGTARLVAYVVGDLASADARAFLADRLPAAMIPTAFVPMAELPVTVNGKLDRRALPPPPPETGADTAELSPSQSRVARVWSRLLDLEVTDPDANLFELGGHSLTAARIAQDLGVSIRDVMRCQTVRSLAEVVAAHPEPVANAGTRSHTEPATGTGAADLPLSSAQHRIWLAARRSQAAGLVISDLVRPQRELDPAILTAALEQVVSRHQMLRTSIRATGAQARQVITDRLDGGPPLRLVDLDGCAPDGPEVAEALRRARDVGFEPGRAPLFELRLLRGVTGGDLLTVTAHHLIYDGASVDVLLTDLFDGYDRLRRGEDPAPAPELQFADWVRAEQDWLESPAAQTSAGHWKRRLADAPRSPDLFDPARRRDTRGSTRLVTRELPWSLVEGAAATPNAVAVTAFAAMVHRRTGVRDLVLGFPVSLRDSAAADAMIGCLINAVPLRLELDPALDLGGLLHHVTDRIGESHEHSRLPFDAMIDGLGLRAAPGRSVLFDLGVTFENATLGRQNHRVEDILPRDMTAHSDLWLYAAGHGDRLRLDLAADANLVTATEAEAAADELAELTAAVVTSPGTPLNASPTPDTEPQWSETRYDF